MNNELSPVGYTGVGVIALGLLLGYKFLLKRQDGRLVITASLIIGYCFSRGLGIFIKPAINAIGGLGSVLGLGATVVAGVAAVTGGVLFFDAVIKKNKPHKLSWAIVLVFPIMAATSGVSILTSVNSTLDKSVQSVNQSVQNANLGGK